MALRVLHVEAWNRETGTKFFIDCDDEKMLEKFGLVGSATAATLPNNNTYVFRKMTVEEFKLVKDSQQMTYPKCNPRSKVHVGEKWITESMQHSREYHNASVKVPEAVAEFTVNKKGYTNIRENAIAQRGSRNSQPKNGPYRNVYNKERIPDQSNMLNLGLKGKQNVDDFNKHIVSISKIDPHSYVNKNPFLLWVRRNKVQACAVAIGISIEVAYVTVSIIDDKGSFGKSTQIAFGEIAGGIVGAELAAVIGAKIGAAIGIIVPIWGNIIIGFIGGLIGSLIGGAIVQVAQYVFCVAPASPGPGVPILDTDPYPTYTGIPDQGLNDNVHGVPGQEHDTEAFGVPSIGLDTGAFETPESEYRTRRM